MIRIRPYRWWGWTLTLDLATVTLNVASATINPQAKITLTTPVCWVAH
jgi:hypothetical protein